MTSRARRQARYWSPSSAPPAAFAAQSAHRRGEFLLEFVLLVKAVLVILSDDLEIACLSTVSSAPGEISSTTCLGPTDTTGAEKAAAEHHPAARAEERASSVAGLAGASAVAARSRSRKPPPAGR